jgi:hypothetical protein
MVSFVLGFTLSILAGCAWLPTGLRIGGTPVEKLEKKNADEEAKKKELMRKSQEAAHKAQTALKEAPPSRPVEVADDFLDEAVDSLDQALGQPMVGDMADWKSLAIRLLSDDAKVRATAEKERDQDRKEVAALSEKLAKATAAKDAAETKAIDYAKKTDAIADILRKGVFVAVGLFALWALSQVLTIASKFVPQLSAVSGLVNMIAAPAVHSALKAATKDAAQAKDGLVRVGRAIGEAEVKAPEIADKIRVYLNKHTDETHQETIGAAATETARDLR